MNCHQVRDRLPLGAYGDLPPAEAETVERHVAACPDCRRELAQLRDVRRLLDAAPAAPPAAVSLPRLFEEAARGEQRRTRRWRRAAVALLASAALLLLALSLHLEVRWEPHQLVVRWGLPPEPPAGPTPTPAESAPPPVSPDELRLVKDLIHALAEDAADRDLRQRQVLLRLQTRLDAVQRLSELHWAAAERDVAALYTAQFGTRDQGDRP
jgi:hypothetical protein